MEDKLQWRTPIHEDSVLKFGTGIDIFIDIPKTESSHVSIDSPVQCYPEKQVLYKFLFMVFNGMIFLAVNHFVNNGEFGKTPGLTIKW